MISHRTDSSALLHGAQIPAKGHEPYAPSDLCLRNIVHAVHRTYYLRFQASKNNPWTLQKLGNEGKVKPQLIRLSLCTSPESRVQTLSLHQNFTKWV